MVAYNCPVKLLPNLSVGKKVRGSQTSAENDPLVAVIKVIMVWYKCPQLLIYLRITSVGSMIIFQIRRWGPKFSSKCSRLCWILSCLRTAGWHCFVFLQTLDSIKPVVRNQWSMSRPLLGLILLNEDYFQVVLWKTMKILLYITNLFFLRTCGTK